MKAALLSPLISFLPDEPFNVSVAPPSSFRNSYVNAGGDLKETDGDGPPQMPYLLRGHRLVEEWTGDDTGSSWWVRQDHGDSSGPSSRRSLDSAVYRVFKDNNQDRRRAWWLDDWFAGPSESSPSSTGASSDDGPRPGNPVPLPSNIDATHFAPTYIPPVGDIEREFMVVSGGFTDTDWTTFPVWAFELNSTSSSETNWRDLSGLDLGRAGSNDKDAEEEATSHITWPPGRVGHVSSLHEGDLYIFGGMLWKDKDFVVEEAPYVWKARVEDKLNPPEDSLRNETVLEWDRIIPTVQYYQQGNISSPGDTFSGQEMTLTRGECRGGHWASGSALVFYGGLHVKHQLSGHNKDTQEDVALGDIWMYNYTSETMEQLSPYPPPESHRDEWGRYPAARTAHAATIVGNSLFVYGGMTSSAWSASQGEGGATGEWDELSDLWEFNLVERKWSERYMTPELSRSYHSMVGWGDGSLAVFGGFRTARTISGEPIAFVFSDTLVSHPNDPTWWKAQWPHDPESGYRLSASNRLEHTAAVNKFGSMYVWGGRFKTVSQIRGMWSIDVFNADSNVVLEPAPPDGLEAYEAELEALHVLVAVMLLMSVLFTALYGTLRRQAMENEGGGGNANSVGILGRRRGLSREVIDAIPIKTYGNAETSAAPESTAESEPDNGGLSDVGLEDEECCPICLLEYEQGEELRLLPCNHEFHKECVDSWLENNTSCPACRHALSNTVPNTSLATDEMEHTSDGIWRVEHIADPMTMAPQVSLTQLLAGRELGWFGPMEPSEENTNTSESPRGSANIGSIEDDSNVHAEEEDEDLGTGTRRRLFGFGFARYFSLPQSRLSEPSSETLGETEMTELGESSRPSAQVV